MKKRKLKLPDGIKLTPRLKYKRDNHYLKLKEKLKQSL